MPGEKRWIFVPAFDNEPPNNVKSDYNGHGSCVLSKAAGAKFGIAKNADVVIVKLPDSKFISFILLGLNMIADDIEKNKVPKPVVTLTIGTVYFRAW